MRIFSNKGYAIYFVLLFFGIVTFSLTSVTSLGVSNLRAANQVKREAQAFYLAESAAEKAKILLRDNYETALYNDVDSATKELDAGKDDGEYYYNLSPDPNGDSRKRQITGYGAVPDFDNAKSSRAIQVVVRKPPALPVDLWDYAIRSSEDIDANGNTYDVVGDVIAAYTITHQHDRIPGAEDIDETIHPLAALDFEILKAYAQSQVYDGHDNYYTAAEIAAGSPSLPTSFYFAAPSESNPLGTPHVVYIESDLTLHGTFGNVGGFIIVVGNIDTGANGATTINGNGTINGVVYTIENFTVNGGGGGLNVLGGVICGGDARMNGNTNITFWQPYMDAIESLNPPPGMTVLSWNEVESPYD